MLASLFKCVANVDANFQVRRACYNRYTCVKRESIGQVKLNGRWKGIIGVRKNKGMFWKGENLHVAGGQKGLAAVPLCQCQNKWL